ncbi:MAG: hypothetical protein NFCOHLIN_01817 [Gammaproteobacteria bacterium]|nr:hypothetical protein [Gammaproteobacteria bacterium]
MPRRSRIACLIALFGALGAAHAEQSSSYGDYTVHYSAFTTDTLQPEVAKAYQIERSSKRGMVNVSVLKKLMGTAGQPVRADVKVTATNLHGQAQTIPVRELNDGGAVYYIGEFPVSDQDTLKFHIEATPEGQTEGIRAQFDQEFFTD